MVWKPQTYASKNKLETTSLGSLRMKKRTNDSDEADDEASEDCRRLFFSIKGKKCKSLHEDLRPQKVQYDIPSLSKKNAKAPATGRESPETAVSDRPSTPKDNLTSVKRDKSKKRSDSPAPSKSRNKEFNLAPELKDLKNTSVELPIGCFTPYQVGLVTPTISDFQEKRVQFDLRTIPRFGKRLKKEKDDERDDSVSSEPDSQCPLNKPTVRTDRTESGKESKRCPGDICDKPKETVDKKIEILSSASSIFREGKFRPREYVSGGWCIRLDTSRCDLKESTKPKTTPIVNDSVDKKESFSHTNNFSPSPPREQSPTIGGERARRKSRGRVQKLGRDRSPSASENPFKEIKNKVEPIPFSSWKYPIRRTSVSAGNSPDESLVKFDDPRMWRSKESSKREDHNVPDFQCSHNVTKKSSSLTQDSVDESRDSDDFSVCTINESINKGNSLRTKFQFPLKRTENRNNANNSRGTLEFSHEQCLDLYSTDTDATDVTRRSHSCPLKRRVRRTADGISASMRQECVETNSQIHLKIESEFKIEIPGKGKEKYLIEGQEKRPISILRNTKKVQFGEEDNSARNTDSQPTIIVRPSFSIESSPSKTGFVASLVSEDIVFPERERSPPVPPVKVWREPESSDSPVYQTVSPCCESSTSMEGTVIRKHRHEHFNSRGVVKKKEDVSSALNTDAIYDAEASPERKGKGKDLVREYSNRKQHHRKCDSTDDVESNEHRNFGFRGGSVKGQIKAPKLTFPPHPLVESKFIAKKRDLERRDVEYRIESARSESSIASSSSCYHNNINSRSQKNTEEKKSCFGYGSKFLRQTVKQTRYASKYFYDPSSSNNETTDDLPPSIESTSTSISARKYKPLLRDVLRYLPTQQNLAMRTPPDVKRKVEGADPIIPPESTVDRINHALGREELERSKPIPRESNASQDQLQLRGVSIGSSVSWCGPKGSLTAMTKSLLYVDNPMDSHSEMSSQCTSVSQETAAAKRRVWKMEKALKKSVSSGSYTSAHSKVSSSPEDAYESCSCPRMFGCADKKKLNVASQTDVTGLEVQNPGSIINFLDTAWEVKKFLRENKRK